MSQEPNNEIGQLRRRIGDISQLVSTRAATLSDGNEDGVRIVDARASGGLSAVVLADRGMDIGAVWAAGYQVAWQSTTGAVHPAYFHEADWLRSFHGGLLTTCGLQNVGLPSVEDGTDYGLHGRISNTAARNVSHRVIEQDGALLAEISGEMRETDVFGSDLLLRRRITLPVGKTVLRVEDEVVNQGYRPTALMLLYHVNVGWPVVADEALLVTPPADITPRDEAARTGMADRVTFVPPRDGFEEQVFRHDLLDHPGTQVHASIVNPAFAPTGGIGLTVSWDPGQLPYLWQWRMLRPGMYLTGLEPANCGLAGRATERAMDSLRELEPGEVYRSGIEVEVRFGDEAQRLAGEVRRTDRTAR